ncbi:Mur ligase domain-containing protein [Fulvivirgaceae bacterium BMA10]|uniref:Mur ligase domain-containing protein n=1 Tax=Splendidivirga corallicola TaxID=3051826 RepID=A0ABT8KH18_9BACT|nr:Mur ligase domain-containing protein [Fulvivirgaceae bacterium BMA10]
MHHKNNRIHFIAIGGSVMHGLAIALKEKGFDVSGSDDQIYEPSRSNLEKHNLLPAIGWNPNNITKDIDAVILGMHARSDNPELQKALDAGIKVYSYPEFIYEQSKSKQRIVIAGSHGKTSITAMIIHVLNYHKKRFDFLIGSRVNGFENQIRLTEEAPMIILEGDEYLSSPIDKTPKFLKYHHHIGLISGISWDHINVFPTESEYVRQFDRFADASPKAGSLIYCEEDPMTAVIGGKERADVNRIEYKTHPFTIKDGKTYLTTENGDVAVPVFGEHNMQNIAGAQRVLARLGITDPEFYEAMQSFNGASNRLELVDENQNTSIYKDFAHAPSKVQATTSAFKKQFNRPVVACLELHTFSSLNKDFLPNYAETLDMADLPIVYYDHETLQHKGLPDISPEDVKEAFNNEALVVKTSKEDLQSFLIQQDWKDKNLLMMSSGNFGGIDLKTLSEKILN